MGRVFALFLLCGSSSDGSPSLRASVALRVLRGGRPLSGVAVTLENPSLRERRETDGDGLALFSGIDSGVYTISLDTTEQRIFVPAELVAFFVDLEAPSGSTVRFGRFDLTSEDLARLPHADTVSSVLETLDPFAITNRIDVAGVESATDPLWSVRGSSWTQNRVLLDGVDVTDPAGGAGILYPDLAFFEELSLSTSAQSPEAAGPGSDLHIVTRTGAASFGGAFRVRYTGSALQSQNLDEALLALGVEPREMLRFPNARLELGAPGFYAAVNGFGLATGLPKFEAEEKTSLVSVTGKVLGARGSILGIAQRVGRPTFGARPGFSTDATVDATETFQIAQASLRSKPVVVRLGHARGNLESPFDGDGAGTPTRDLATGDVSGAPPVVVDRERTRWTAVASGDWAIGTHLVRAGVELSRASESSSERVPGSAERLTVDGTPHAVTFFAGPGDRNVTVSRIALHGQDAFFFDFLAVPWRLSPGVRFDASRSGPIRWTSLSGSVVLGAQLAPSAEIHVSLGTYPQVLTTRPLATTEALSWVRHRWADDDADGDVDAGEVGDVLRRGGGDFTAIDESLPRPRTDEFTVGIEKRFRRGFLRLSGYQRWERNLLQTRNVGIAPESYRTLLFHDVGVDGVLGSDDDVEIPVFDQTAQFGEDLFLLTHPEGLDSFAQGVDLLVGFDHGRFSWRLSGRAYRDVGRGNVGNDATENDTGTLGDLFDDPNTGTNAEGRLFFDRAFTGKLALTAEGPREVRFGTAIRYWDGQPFARHLFFPDLGQGFVTVQAFSRGRLRYAFNMTVDVRAEREFVVGPARIGLALDVFNVFNQTLQTGEDVRSGERFRDPTFVQPARTIVLEGRVRF